MNIACFSRKCQTGRGSPQAGGEEAAAAAGTGGASRPTGERSHEAGRQKALKVISG